MFDAKQVQNKYYTNLQLLDQYKEWGTLHRMRKKGCNVRVPRLFIHFVKVMDRGNKPPPKLRPPVRRDTSAHTNIVDVTRQMPSAEQCPAPPRLRPPPRK